MQSFIPNKNMAGMYNFKTGGGKSPSFFFFSDNNKIMMKTLKESEMTILFDKNFLLYYFQYLMTNPNSLLMKIFGVYKLVIGKQNAIYFILTENMIEND